MQTWHHTLGARDVTSGVAMLVAPAALASGPPRCSRIVSDLSDALAFGLHEPLPLSKAKAVGAAAGYAALNALSLRWAGKRARRNPRRSSGRPAATVVGSGVAGLTAAHLLHAHTTSPCSSPNNRLGGHAHTQTSSPTTGTW